ncbi:DUF2169 family type VI secretion system accessory protein [Sorangium cellulosum]|uniref:DUF2169 family type VI secretion system accessory protein n=1 Tax=Sorangium cellulosum TaxID=56 RepID=UPI001331C1EB|nr:DUF2169 domain-containing protein [Sorangium cellulosum]
MRETYDALLDLFPWEGGRPAAYVLVKQTYTIAGETCVLAPPRPLFHDLRDETLAPRLRPGTDYWPHKQATDFVVRGAACAPGGKPVSAMTVSAGLGGASKRIAVFGRRAIRWTAAGAPVIGEPEPFTRVPITYENAYGGVDARVRPGAEVSPPQAAMAAMRIDHPGMYPRNPYGKGYLVLAGPLPGAEMPNLEDPADLLAPERLASGDPARWYERPLPACFDWVPAMTFPRYHFFGPRVDPWFPAPDDARLPEVRLGILPAGYRSGRPTGVAPRFFQEAPPGFVLADVRGDEPVRIEGMHPERAAITFRLPGPPPAVEFSIEGRRAAVPVRTHSVVVEPEAGELYLLYAATVELPRPFLPGVHKYIPIEVSIGNDRPIAYEPPPTVRDQLAAAGAQTRPVATQPAAPPRAANRGGE